MIKNWLIYIGGLAGAVVFHIFYFGWYSWFILVLALALPWFSLLVSLPVMLRVRLRLRVAERCECGEQVFAVLKAADGGFAACVSRVRIEVRCAMTGEKTVVRRSLRGSGGLRLAVDTSRCGVFRCSAAESRVYDYLGLFGLPVRGSTSAEIVVCPAPVPPRPLPDMTRFMARSRRPKPGGGFSEEHENREYRPGDNLRDIHWKLSAKTDSLVVREAQEPIREQCLLTFDLRASGPELDSVIAQLIWLSRWLLDHGAEHQIRWIDPADRSVTSAWVRSREDLLPLLRRVLGAPLRENMPSIAEHRFSEVAWRYHILPGREVQK